MNKKKVGIFGGSFNPPHVGHIEIGKSIRNYCDLDEVWYLPSYNPLKDFSGYISKTHILEMLEIALEGLERVKICALTMDREEKTYMIDTLTELSSKYSDCEFSLIIGEDNLRNIEKWKRWKDLIHLYRVLVVPRKHELLRKRDEVNYKRRGKIEVLRSFSVPEVSSSTIRNIVTHYSLLNSLDKEKFLRLIHPKVFEYIQKEGLYSLKDRFKTF